MHRLTPRQVSAAYMAFARLLLAFILVCVAGAVIALCVWTGVLA